MPHMAFVHGIGSWLILESECKSTGNVVGSLAKQTNVDGVLLEAQGIAPCLADWFRKATSCLARRWRCF